MRSFARPAGVWRIALLVAAACSDTHAPAPLPPALAPRSDIEVTELGSAEGSEAEHRLHVDDVPCDQIREIEIWKRSRALVASCRSGSGMAIRVALGREDDGPKRTGHDNRTPEGFYRIAAPARPSQKFHMFIPIDYPSVADAERGIAEGIIDDDDYQAIVDAHEDGRVPPQTTRLGGHLGFHGEGPRWQGDSANLNWTYGCIALADDQIEFIAERSPPGTPVIIRP